MRRSRSRLVLISAIGIFVALGAVSAIRAEYDPPGQNPVIVGKFFPGPYFVKHLALKPGWHALGTPNLPPAKPVIPPGSGGQQTSSVPGKTFNGSVSGIDLGSIGASDGAVSAEQKLERRLKTLAQSLR